jgi:lipopolysaccharide biosynthesis glycosyltransferase
LLYIDSDTLVIGNLQELYQLDLSGYPLAAAKEPYPESREYLGWTDPHPYFNSGVLLIDVPKWNHQLITERAFAFVRDNPEAIRYVDQDALNAVLVGNWMPLDNRFNLTLEDVHIQIPKRTILAGKIIIHFTSERKPWLCLSQNKLRSPYHYYKWRSPKKFSKRYTDFSLNKTKPFLMMRLKELYFEKKIYKLISIGSLKNIQHCNY